MAQCHGRLFCKQNLPVYLPPLRSILLSTPIEQGYRLILHTSQMLMSVPTNAPVELDSLSVPDLYPCPTASSHDCPTSYSHSIDPREFFTCK